MATLYFSNQLMSAMVLGSAGVNNNLFRFFGGLQNSSSPNSLGSNNTSGAVAPPRLNIYGGVMPTDFSTFTDTTQRAGDLLISFALPNAISYIDLGNANDVSRRILAGRHPSNQAASASGVATWFLLAQSYSTSLGDKAAVIGSVGAPGSGADLVVPNVNIIAGVNYQSSGFVLNFPYAYNV